MAALSNYSDHALEAGHSPEKLKKDMGLEMFGFVNGSQASAEFLSFLPEYVKVRIFCGVCALCGRGGGWCAILSISKSGAFYSISRPAFLFTLDPILFLTVHRAVSTNNPWSS